MVFYNQYNVKLTRSFNLFYFFFLESVWQKKLKNASTNKQNNVIGSQDKLIKIFSSTIFFLCESSDMNDCRSISEKYSDHSTQLPTLWTYCCFPLGRLSVLLMLVLCYSTNYTMELWLACSCSLSSDPSKAFQWKIPIKFAYQSWRKETWW